MSQECMSICAGPGDLIRFTNIDGVGLKSQLDEVMEKLTLDKIYTISRVVVEDCFTRVWVFSKGSKGPVVGPFNSVFFTDVVIDEERAEARSKYIDDHYDGIWDTSKKGYGYI